MITGRLIMALDFPKDKNAKREVYSYRKEGKWYWVSAGPGYSNTYEVTDCDEEGLSKLESMELKEDNPKT